MSETPTVVRPRTCKNVTLDMTTIHLQGNPWIISLLGKSNQLNSIQTKQNKTSCTFQFCSYNVSKGDFLRRKEKSIGIHFSVCESQNPVLLQILTISQCLARDICHCHSYETLQIEMCSRILQEIDFNSTLGSSCSRLPHSVGKRPPAHWGLLLKGRGVLGFW